MSGTTCQNCPSKSCIHFRPTHSKRCPLPFSPISLYSMCRNTDHWLLLVRRKLPLTHLVFTTDTLYREREDRTVGGVMGRTLDQPQVKLSLLRSTSLNRRRRIRPCTAARSLWSPLQSSSLPPSVSYKIPYLKVKDMRKECSFANAFYTIWYYFFFLLQRTMRFWGYFTVHPRHRLLLLNLSPGIRNIYYQNFNIF